MGNAVEICVVLCTIESVLILLDCIDFFPPAGKGKCNRIPTNARKAVDQNTFTGWYILCQMKCNLAIAMLVRKSMQRIARSHHMQLTLRLAQVSLRTMHRPSSGYHHRILRKWCVFDDNTWQPYQYSLPLFKQRKSLLADIGRHILDVLVVLADTR